MSKLETKKIQWYSKYYVDELGDIYKSDGKKMKPQWKTAWGKKYMVIWLTNVWWLRKSFRADRLIAASWFGLDYWDKSRSVLLPDSWSIAPREMLMLKGKTLIGRFPNDKKNQNRWSNNRVMVQTSTAVLA